MTEQRSKEAVCDTDALHESETGSPWTHEANCETEAVEHAEQEVGRLSRRAALLLGTAAAASAVVPVEPIARVLAHDAGTQLFLDRMRRAIEAVKELQNVRAELAACQARILRMDPSSLASYQERSQEGGLMYLQREAETRVFRAANSFSCHAPDDLKAETWKVAVTLHRYNFKGSLGYVKPDLEKWDRKRHAFLERRRAGSVKKTTTA